MNRHLAVWHIEGKRNQTKKTIVVGHSQALMTPDMLNAVTIPSDG